MVKGELAKRSTTATLKIGDSKLLQRVAGPHDSHIKIIERQLDVTIRTVDEGLSVTGAADGVAKTKQVVTDLLSAAHNKQITIDDGFVTGLLRQSSGGPVEKITTRKKHLTARTPLQGDYIRLLRERELVFGVGPAGTGKTYLATAYAAAMLERGEVERIILTRPAVEAGERLGFLPGDMKEKVDPYLRPLYDALYDMLTPQNADKLIEDGTIEIAPLAFMRGRTLRNAAIILDEAQNTTTMQMKMFLTRLGEGSKMFITGDVTQIDLPPNVHSGLKEALTVLKGEKEIGVVEFTDKDIVRHPLVGRIVSAYERHALTLKNGG